MGRLNGVETEIEKKNQVGGVLIFSNIIKIISFSNISGCYQFQNCMSKAETNNHKKYVRT